MAKKKIAIVGAGAVGCYAGAHMVQAGEDVTYIDPWPENVEAIRNDGLRVTHIRDIEPFTVKPERCTSPRRSNSPKRRQSTSPLCA